MKSKGKLDEAVPTAIGKPALRALASAEIRSLEAVARVSEEQLAALHGVGPRAIGILRAALKAHRSRTVARPPRPPHGRSR
jgi:hypothetical protein